MRQGVNTYRFSIAWSRVLPTGHIDNINEKGLEYYRDLIQKLRENNIEPLVTMHHWDNPRAIEDEGGFLNDVSWSIFLIMVFEITTDGKEFLNKFNYDFINIGQKMNNDI